MDKKKLLFSILKEVEQENEPNHTHYGIDKEDFGSIVEMAIEKRFIKNANVTRGGQGNKVVVVFLKGSQVTFDGLTFLEENSALAKTYRGLKEIREWFKL